MSLLRRLFAILSGTEKTVSFLLDIVPLPALKPVTTNWGAAWSGLKRRDGGGSVAFDRLVTAAIYADRDKWGFLRSQLAGGKPSLRVTRVVTREKSLVARHAAEMEAFKNGEKVGTCDPREAK